MLMRKNDTCTPCSCLLNPTSTLTTMRASTSLLISTSKSLAATATRRSRRGQASEVGLAAAALLAPLPLYRRILRSHRSLPVEMKSLGDTYVKDEFKKHKDVENPLQIVGFLTQWKIYLDGIEENMATGYKGQPLDVAKFEKVRLYCCERDNRC
jgi:hypothetical protein